MKSLKMPGKNIEPVEIIQITNNGIRLLADGKELFMSYTDFPWFKDSPVKKILNLKEIHPGHFYWPDLYVDLTIEIIEHPERFPVKMK